MSAPTRNPRAAPEAPEPAPAADPVRRRGEGPHDRGTAPEWPLYLAAALLTTALTTWALRLWNATWSVPMAYVGDAVAVQAHAKTVLETGWYEFQPALGAPVGQRYHEFPTADNLHMMAFRVLGWVLPDSATVMNAYYVIGFPLAAVAGLWFLRRCGVSGLLAVALAVLFALSPYHFERNEGHLFLSSYFTVPLALGVVWMALRGDRLWGRRTGVRRPWSYLVGPGAFTVLAMAVVGTASSYYAVFVALLLAAAGILAWARDRDLGRLLGAAGAGVALVATMLANMAPDILFGRGRAPNALALVRYPEEAEIYALKAVQLVLPSAQHRFERLGALREFYNRTFPLPSESPTLGLVAAAGFTTLLVVVLVALVLPSARGRAQALVQLSVLNLVGFLAATVGGLSSFIAVVLTDNLRGWSRMTILLGLLALAAVGVLVDAVLDRARSRLRSPVLRRAAAATVAVGVLTVGCVDQTSPFYVPPYAANAAAYSSDGTYVEGLEADLPTGAMVFQLPFIEFPESPPVNGVQYTDQIRMFLHSSDLRWSSGGLRGRPETDWAQVTASRAVPELVDRLAVAGFAGVHVDSFPFPDGGASLGAELTALLGEPTRTSPDGRYRYWPLAAAVERLEADLPPERLQALREAVLLPVVPYTAPELTGPARVKDRQVWTSRTATPHFSLDNPRSVPVQVRLRFTVRSPSGAPAALVTLPDGDPRLVALDPEEVVATTLDVPPGRSTVRIAVPENLLLTGAVDPRSARFEVVDLTVEDPVLDGFGS